MKQHGIKFAHYWVLGALAATVFAMPGTTRAQASDPITYVQGADIDTLDPAVTRSTTSQIVISHLFNRLVAWDGRELKRIVPDLAES